MHCHNARRGTEEAINHTSSQERCSIRGQQQVPALAPQILSRTKASHCIVNGLAALFVSEAKPCF